MNNSSSFKNYRPKIPVKIKNQLLNESGRKCANPGCSATTLEYHHINQWHVYQTHDLADMIALCPNCHRNSHYGFLMIDEATIRFWKRIRRPTIKRGHLYVEPGNDCKILLGSIYLQNESSTNPFGMTVFQLSSTNKVSFRIVDNDILLTNLVTTVRGQEVVRVVDGHLRAQVDEPVRYEARPGKHRITAPAAPEYIPAWVLDLYDQSTTEFSAGKKHSLVDEKGRFTILDLEVINRGVLQIQGVWVEGDLALVVGRDWLSIKLPIMTGFGHIRGYADSIDAPKDLNRLPVFTYSGDLNFSALSGVLECGYF